MNNSLFLGAEFSSIKSNMILFVKVKSSVATHLKDQQRNRFSFHRVQTCHNKPLILVTEQAQTAVET